MIDISYCDYLNRFKQIIQQNTNYAIIFSEDNGKCTYSIRDLDMTFPSSIVSFDSLAALDDFLYRLIGVSILSNFI